LKKDNPKFKTEVIAAAQNLSVDNANEQGMYKVNMNTHTFAAYSVLNFLGFEEDISAPFMSQPIIVDYVNRMRESNSILKGYNPNLEKEIVDALTAKYLNGKSFNDTDNKLADFIGKDASKEMLQILADRESYENYGKVQVAILNKFLKLSSYERLITPIKQLLNLDSKGFHKSMFVNKERVDFVESLQDNQILNADRLFGEYTKVESDGITNGVIINPTTLAGLDNTLGNTNLVKMFGGFFLETKASLNFSKIVSHTSKIIGRINNTTRTELSNSYKSYLMSNININDTDQLRHDLFTSKEEGSLYSDLRKLELTSYWRDNSFLSGLQVEFSGGILNIDYNNAAGDNFDETNIYLSFIDLFRQDAEINGVIPSKMAEDLVLYSLLRGDFKAKQFIKLIPIDIIKKVVTIPEIVSDTASFVDQWIRHNPDRTPVVEKYQRISKNVIRVTEEVATPEYINTVDKYGNISLYKRVDGSASNYERINTLGGDNFTEYTFNPTYIGKSIIKSNNKVDAIPVQKADTDGTQISTDTHSKDKVTTGNVLDRLDTTTGSTLLQSIMELEDFPEYSNLAKAIKNQVPRDLQIKINDSNQVFFSYTPPTISIGMERFNGLGSKDILSIIMHEYMHAVTVDNINNFIVGTAVDKNVKQAINRLSSYKNKVIDELSDEQFNTFRNIVVKYAVGVSPYKLETLMQDATTHPQVAGWLKSVHDYQVNPISDTDGSVKQMIDTANRVKYDENTLQAYYALINLKEFVAVSSTSGTARKTFIDIAGKDYIERIRELFKALLQALGIETGIENALMTDILTVAEVDESLYETEDFISVPDDLNTTLESLEREGEEIKKNCKGKESKPKAAKGMRDNFKPGSKWSMVEDLKGLPSHKSGGVDLTIHEGGVAFSTEKGYMKAENGIFIPKRKPQFKQGNSWKQIELESPESYRNEGVTLPRTKKNTDYTTGSSWSIAKDLEGFPSHNKGGISIFVDENSNVGFTSKDSKVMAKYGLVIKAERD
jgi:hypothetical protein